MQHEDRQQPPMLVGEVKATFAGKKPTTYDLLSFDPGTALKDARASIAGVVAWCKKKGLTRVEYLGEDERAIQFLQHFGFRREPINTGAHAREDMEYVYVLHVH